MATCTILAEPQPEAVSTPRPPHGQAVVAWMVLGVVLAVGVPLFLCMPLWWDVLHYDVLARAVLRGAALYRDMDDNNLPGMSWMQAAVRGIATRSKGHKNCSVGNPLSMAILSRSQRRESMFRYSGRYHFTAYRESPMRAR